MTQRRSGNDIAGAIAFFEDCDDLDLLLDLLRRIQPRAAAQVRRLVSSRRPLPQPAEIEAADQPSTRADAVKTLDMTQDFALLQALSRAIGRRVEELQGGEP